MAQQLGGVLSTSKQKRKKKKRKVALSKQEGVSSSSVFGTGTEAKLGVTQSDESRSHMKFNHLVYF